MTLVERLRAAGCVFAEDEAAVLVAATDDPSRLESLVARRVAGEPLEYVVGYADFCDVRVRLDPGVFIPRQRTAFLVRAAAALVPPSCVAVDLCCGSGALGLAFGALVPDAEVHAADVDPAAVACARRNLRRVYEGDLFAALPDDLRGRVDVVLANVPYVPTSALDAMPVEAREYEPVSTRDGGDDGLDLLRRVAADVTSWVRPGGHLLVEISDRQTDAARVALAGFDVRIEENEDDGSTIVIVTVR